MAGAGRHPNIFVVGAQSTGKSTLVDRLQSFFLTESHSLRSQPTIIREVARQVLRTQNFSREDITSSPQRALQLQWSILRAQVEAEDSILGAGGLAGETSAHSWYISDRSSIDPVAYAHYYVGADAAELLLASAEWELSRNRMRPDCSIVFLCEAGCPWLVDDGTRVMPKDEAAWRELDGLYRALLERAEIKYTVVPKEVCNIEERVKLVLRAWEEHNRSVQDRDEKGPSRA